MATSAEEHCALRAGELGACSAWSQETPREEERALWFAGCHVTYLKSLRNSRGLSGAVYLPDAVCPTLP